jgi:uncharacterized protein (TIGR01244 family)
MKTGRLSDKVVVGAQPSADDLAKLRARDHDRGQPAHRGRANQPLSPSEEATLSENMGLSYRHVPVSLSALDPKQVEDVRAAIRSAQGPVYVHCGAGQRACAIALLAEEGEADTGSLIAKADAVGFPVTDPHLRSFIEQETPKGDQD